MDRLDAMRVFVRVVETGSFSAAARELRVGQPAVSKQIAALEARVGVELLRRTSRSVRLTDAGGELYVSARRLVAELDAALQNAALGANAIAGVVRVSAPPAFGQLMLVARLPRLLARHAHLSVELHASHRHVSLVEENIDIAVRTGELADSSLVKTPLGATRVVTVGASSYLRKHGVPKTPGALRDHACIVFVRDGAPRPWRFSGTDGAFTWETPGLVRSSDAGELRSAILAGLGLAQVPAWLVARELESGAVREVLGRQTSARLPISAVRPAGKPPAPRVAAFLEFLRDVFASEPTLCVPVDRPGTQER